MKAPLFLRAKHWQIFIPLMAFPFVTMIAFMIFMAINFVVAESSRPEDVLWVFNLMPIFFILCAGTQMLWMWNVGVNLRKYIHSSDRKPRVRLFRFTFFFPIFYMCVFPFIMMSVMEKMEFGHNHNPASIIPLVLMMFFGHFTTMFCFLNNNYVVTKTIKMAELQRKVTFNDFVGDFFFMLVFPVAIWFLQPRINKIVSGEEEMPLVRETVIERDLLD